MVDDHDQVPGRVQDALEHVVLDAEAAHQPAQEDPEGDDRARPHRRVVHVPSAQGAVGDDHGRSESSPYGEPQPQGQQPDATGPVTGTGNETLQSTPPRQD